MAWIESHQSLRDHPKTRKAARALEISVPAMIGHLHCLWHQALDLALDGDLTRWDHDDIAHAAMWDGDPAQFVDALVVCGFADGPGFLDRTDDGRLIIHDWEDYTAGLRKRQQASAKANHDRWHVDKGVVQPACDLCPDADPPDSGSDTTSVLSASERTPNGDPDGSDRTPPDLTGPDRTNTPASAEPAREEEPAVLLADAVLDACGMDPPADDTSAAGALAKALADLERHGATADQVPARAARFRRIWPDATLTPLALAKHWPQLGRDSPRDGPSGAMPEMTDDPVRADQSDLDRLSELTGQQVIG